MAGPATTPPSPCTRKMATTKPKCGQRLDWGVPTPAGSPSHSHKLGPPWMRPQGPATAVVPGVLADTQVCALGPATPNPIGQTLGPTHGSRAFHTFSCSRAEEVAQAGPGPSPREPTMCGHGGALAWTLTLTQTVWAALFPGTGREDGSVWVELTRGPNPDHSAWSLLRSFSLPQALGTCLRGPFRALTGP